MRQKGLKPDLGYDYKYINDEEIILKPEGFDPDEEELELDYFYSG